MCSDEAAVSTTAFEAAERRLFAACGLEVRSRRVRLADPPVAVRVLELGEGPPVVLVPGSGMSASTWAPLMAHLPGHRLIALDLPGFGLSDPYDYGGRPLREHAVAQLTSLLDALELQRAAVVGTSLGAMWALCLAVDGPERVTAIASLGVPALALPGVRPDPFFAALSIPGLRHVVARMRSPSVAMTRRSMTGGVVGPRGAALAPDGFFETVHEGMRQPGFRTAMTSHLWLAFSMGRARSENFLADAELREIAAPVLMIWGEDDPYGSPEMGRRAAALIPDAQLEVIPGRHAPFLDDPQHCGALIEALLQRARSTGSETP